MVEPDDNEEIHNIQTVTKDASWADLASEILRSPLQLTSRAGHMVKVMPL